VRAAGFARSLLRRRPPDEWELLREVAAVIEPVDGGRIRVEFRRPQRAVAPGQSVAMYLGDEVLGGGRIVESFR